MKIAIIGPGAIGRLLGAALAQGGHHVVMVCRREEQATQFLQHGLTYHDAAGAAHNLPVDAVHQGHNEKWSVVDGVLITVKSYDTETAARQLAAQRTDAPVLSLQNGLGNAETLARHLDPSCIAVALTTHGATSDGETTVWHKGQGGTVIGGIAADSSAAKWWSELLTSCGHPTAISDDILTEVWSKAMVNIGINPFTALLGVPNGQLLHEPEILPLMKQVVEEAERIAHSQGIHLHGSFERVLDVCQKTANNTSSMLQDLQKGRRTEIDAMCGEIVAIAEKSGLEAPTNFFLKKIVKKGETKWCKLSSLELRDKFESFLASLSRGI